MSDDWWFHCLDLIIDSSIQSVLEKKRRYKRSKGVLKQPLVVPQSSWRVVCQPANLKKSNVYVAKLIHHRLYVWLIVLFSYSLSDVFHLVLLERFICNCLFVLLCLPFLVMHFICNLVRIIEIVFFTFLYAVVFVSTQKANNLCLSHFCWITVVEWYRNLIVSIETTLKWLLQLMMWSVVKPSVLKKQKQSLSLGFFHLASW